MENNFPFYINMILDELKILIKDFEIVLSKDLRFKNDMDFKNQVKTIYGTKKPDNILMPTELMFIDNAEIIRLKNKIKYLEKTEPHVCPTVHKCPVCPACPVCKETDYNSGNIPETDKIRRDYEALPRQLTEEEDLRIILENRDIAILPIAERNSEIREIDKRFLTKSDEEIEEIIKRIKQI